MKPHLATDPVGQGLVDFQCEPELFEAERREIPCPLALVVARAEQKVLFGLNRWRKQWELPGGMIEARETPRSAASRELSEETGIEISSEDLAWSGLATFELADPQRLELASVFVAELGGQPRSTASYELTELGWFDLDRMPPSHAVLDLEVARLALRGRAE